jgi:hypothetical protein
VITTAALFLLINGVVHGWLWMCSRIEDYPHRQPRLYQVLGEWRRFVGLGAWALGFVAIGMLFCVRWYAGLIGIAAGYLGPLLFSEFLHFVRRLAGIPTTPEEVVSMMSEHEPGRSSSECGISGQEETENESRTCRRPCGPDGPGGTL